MAESALLIESLPGVSPAVVIDEGPPEPAADTPDSSSIIVLKFGSSVIPSEQNLADVVGEVRRWVSAGKRVIAVVSAIGGATDALLAHAKTYGERTNVFALAAYVATGESQAVALLGLALSRAGLDAEVLDAASLGLRTEGPALDARLVSVDARAVGAALARAAVLLVPGFVGRDAAGRTTLLGRGGSDLTALFLAAQLGSRCRLVKDVDGLYDRDPAKPVAAGPPARRYERVSWDEVLALDEGIVQHKAVRYAREHCLAFEVGCLAARHATVVGHDAATFAADSAVAPSNTESAGPIKA